MGDRDERDGTEFGLKGNHRRIENRPRGTHPGAEQGTMRGSLMLGMMPGMLDRLRLCQSADRKDAEYQEDRQKFQRDLVHQQTTQYDSAECYSTATGPVKTASTTGASAYYRIHGKDAVYCAN
jgi:hypothetical protein